MQRSALPPRVLLVKGEFWGETDPVRESIARARCGITLGREQGELIADLNQISRSVS
jgi:hypothetical protein